MNALYESQKYDDDWNKVEKNLFRKQVGAYYISFGLTLQFDAHYDETKDDTTEDAKTKDDETVKTSPALDSSVEKASVSDEELTKTGPIQNGTTEIGFLKEQSPKPEVYQIDAAGLDGELDDNRVNSFGKYFGRRTVGRKRQHSASSAKSDIPKKSDSPDHAIEQIDADLSITKITSSQVKEEFKFYDTEPIFNGFSDEISTKRKKKSNLLLDHIGEYMNENTPCSKKQKLDTELNGHTSLPLQSSLPLELSLPLESSLPVEIPSKFENVYGYFKITRKFSDESLNQESSKLNASSMSIEDDSRMSIEDDSVLEESTREFKRSVKQASVLKIVEINVTGPVDLSGTFFFNSDVNMTMTEDDYFENIYNCE